jgi:hypothetical protein
LFSGFAGCRCRVRLPQEEAVILSEALFSGAEGPAFAFRVFAMARIHSRHRFIPPQKRLSS